MNSTALADKKPFSLGSESWKPVSLLLVVASLCLGMRLVTELTVYMPRAEGLHRTYGFSRSTARNDLWNDEDELTRGINFCAHAQTSACHPGYV